MVVEIAGGYMFNLDGAARGRVAHEFARAGAWSVGACLQPSQDGLRSIPGFTFGTWKIEVLGGYTSRDISGVGRRVDVGQSAERLISPSPIHYDQAIVIAIVGLLVNLACRFGY